MHPRFAIRLHLLLIVFLACGSWLSAQQPGAGAEAQAADERPQLAQPRTEAAQPQARAAQQPKATAQFLPLRAVAPAQPLGEHLLEKALAQRPTKTHRPIPIILVLLGLLLILLFTGALILTLIAPAALFVLFLILTLVFIPLLLLGIIFVIGGLMAGLSGGRAPKPQDGSPK